jgi:hypothetical protein
MAWPQAQAWAQAQAWPQAQAQAWAQAQAQGSQTKAFKWYGVGTCGFFLLSQRKKPMGFCNFPALGLGKTS